MTIEPTLLPEMEEIAVRLRVALALHGIGYENVTICFESMADAMAFQDRAQHEVTASRRFINAKPPNGSLITIAGIKFKGPGQ